MNAAQLFTSVVRTAVPFLVGAIVTFLLKLGVDLPAELQADLSAFLTFLFGSLYYVAVRLLSEKFPKIEWLLGIPAKPTYGGK